MIVANHVRDDQLWSVVSYGSRNKGGLDKLCAFAFAVAPILQHYIGVIQNAGFTVLLLIAPILALKTFVRISKGNSNSECLIAMIPMFLFGIYTVFVHGFDGSRLLLVLFLFLSYLGFSSGSVNVSFFLKYAVAIASFATFIVIIQYISHYLLNYNLDFRFLDYLAKEDTIWESNAAKMEESSYSYFYRPAGIFLEPSHFFLYTFSLIAIMLLSPGINKPRRNVAIFLSLGIILTTSGMGIGCVVVLWTVYFILRNNNYDIKGILSRLFTVRTVLVGLAVVGVLIVAYMFVPIFHSSMARIFEASENQSAMDGRVRLARNFARAISGKAVYIGTKGITNKLEFNLSGFYATFFKWGVVGLILTYWFYIQGIFKLYGVYFWISLILVVISYYTAHTHGTFYMLYFMLFLMNGYYERSILKNRIT